MNRRTLIQLAPCLFFLGCKKSDESKKRDTATVKEEEYFLDAARRHLANADWPEESIDAVLKVHRELLSAIHQDSKQFDLLLAKWKHLSKSPAVFNILSKHPELTSLLANSRDPSLMAGRFANAKQFQTVANLYMIHSDPFDSQRLTEALQRHQTLICRLVDGGIIGAESTFIFDREKETLEAFDQWVNREFDRRRGDLNSEVAFFNFLNYQGRNIRRDMLEIDGFSDRFESDIWPDYQKAIESGFITDSLANLDSDIFRFLQKTHSSELLERYGALATEFFYGARRLDESTHGQLEKVLLVCDQTAVDGLLACFNSPNLRALLKRSDLDAKVAAAAISKAYSNSTNVERLLKQFSRLPMSQLKDEVGLVNPGLVQWLPLYDTYKVAEKVYNGRDLETVETVFGLLDPILLLAGPLNPAKLGKESLKALAKKSGKQIVSIVAKRAGKESIETGLERTAKNSKWILRELFQASRDKLSKKLAFEITGPVQTSFKMSGVGRESFKKLTKLEARIFMRSDRKVVFHFDELLMKIAKSKRVRSYGESKIEASLKSTLERICEQTETDVLLEGDGVGLGTPLESWRKNAATWWSTNSLDLDTLIEDATSGGNQ